MSAKNNLAPLTGKRIFKNTGVIRVDREGLGLAALLSIPAVCTAAWYMYAGHAALAGAAVFFVVAAVYTLYFFRDPERFGPDDPAVAVSAADGVVVDISRTGTGADEGPVMIAVFMNVFNVHVNRTPLPGKVVSTMHQPGKKMSAYNPRAATDNEFGEVEIETPAGRIRIRQIAGLVARRVVTRVSEGDVLDRGDRIGLIRFGSRVDVFLPDGYVPSVAVGDKVRAGETVIAQHNTGEPVGT